MVTNTEVVQAALEAFGRGDIQAVLDMCTEDVDVIFFGDRSTIPVAGQWKGKNRVADCFRIIGETIDVLECEPQHTVAGGNHVAA